tara:strand:- start:444 stop:905 length:462 start_codon:yes stop_codon:yes gene_type:complete
MAYKQSPIGKKKCPYSPMQKRGLISEAPVMLDGNVVSSSGKRPDVDIDRPAIQSEKPRTWTDNYTSTTYSTKSGKGIRKYTPKSNVVGGKPKYYDISKKNPQASMTKINREQYVDMLSKGDKATGEKYTKMTEKDVVTGGDLKTLKELKGNKS